MKCEKGEINLCETEAMAVGLSMLSITGTQLYSGRRCIQYNTTHTLFIFFPQIFLLKEIQYDTRIDKNTVYSFIFYYIFFNFFYKPFGILQGWRITPRTVLLPMYT